LINGEITNGHARALMALEDKNDRLNVLEKIIKKNYSVRKTEEIIKNYKIEKKVKLKVEKSSEVLVYESKLSDKFGTKVRINHNNKYKGKIEIEYYNLEDLNRILEEI
jgi:ParB family chromosome partitioning protein